MIYSSEPDHELCGQALKKLYSKDLKTKLASLSREEILHYLKHKNLEVNGVQIQEDWLKISKNFNDRYKTHATLGVGSNLDASVMLVKTLDDHLKRMGLSREIVNSV